MFSIVLLAFLSFSVVHDGSGGKGGKASGKEITLMETVTSLLMETVMVCSMFRPTSGSSDSVMSGSNPRLQFPR